MYLITYIKCRYRANFVINFIIAPSSLHEDSLCNYKSSPKSNISNTYANNEMDMQMDPPLKYTSEQKENQSDDKKPCNEIFISQIFNNCIILLMILKFLLMILFFFSIFI